MTGKSNSAAEFQKQRAESRRKRRTKLDHPVHAELTVKCGGRRQSETIASLMVASIIGVWE